MIKKVKFAMGDSGKVSVVKRTGPKVKGPSRLYVVKAISHTTARSQMLRQTFSHFGMCHQKMVHFRGCPSYFGVCRPGPSLTPAAALVSRSRGGKR